MRAVGISAGTPLVDDQKKGAPEGAPGRVGRDQGQATLALRGARWTFPAERHRVHTFTRWIFPSITTRTTWRFGFQMRRVLLFACETLFPNATPRLQE
jgi:hypothetical protein